MEKWKIDSALQGTLITSHYEIVRLEFTFSQLLDILYKYSWLRRLVVTVEIQRRRSKGTNLRAKNIQVKQIGEPLNFIFFK